MPSIGHFSIYSLQAMLGGGGRFIRELHLLEGSGY